MFSQALRLTIISVLFISYTLNAQSRIDPDIKNYKNIGIIKDATGWVYNSTENHWTNHRNYISKDTIEIEESNYNQNTIKSKSYQNFESISLKTINYKKHIYYLLVIECLEGEYTYPTLKKDWNYQSETKIFIFEETDINDLKDIKDNLCLSTSRKIVMPKNERNFSSNIERELMRLPNKASQQYKFVIRKIDNETIHFLLPQIYKEDPIETIQNKYFEISLKDYHQLLGIKTQDKSLY